LAHFDVEKKVPTRAAAIASAVGGDDLSMMPEAGALDPADETCREYKRVVDEKDLDEIRAQAMKLFTRSLSRQSAIAKCATSTSKEKRIRSSLSLCES
jgi:hypothetical protein